MFRPSNWTKTFFFAFHFGNEQIYRTKGVHTNSKIYLGVRFEKSLRTTAVDKMRRKLSMLGNLVSILFSLIKVKQLSSGEEQSIAMCFTLRQLIVQSVFQILMIYFYSHQQKFNTRLHFSSLSQFIPIKTSIYQKCWFILIVIYTVDSEHSTCNNHLQF